VLKITTCTAEKLIELPARPTDIIMSSNCGKLLLSSYEQSEILNYKTVYYLGTAKAKEIRKSAAPIRRGSFNRSYREGNFGAKGSTSYFDSANGFYKVIEGDHLAYRYETLKELGRGTFGQVLKCKDHKTGQFVAIKLTKSFSDAGLEGSMREVHILETVKQV
jgi:dual specificity tyrosine-phosphorylation-regulated kinase 2/3/4